MDYSPGASPGLTCLVFFPSLTESSFHTRQRVMHPIVSKHYQDGNYWNSAAKPNKVGTAAIIPTLQRQLGEVKSRIKITELAAGRAG